MLLYLFVVFPILALPLKQIFGPPVVKQTAFSLESHDISNKEFLQSSILENWLNLSRFYPSTENSEFDSWLAWQSNQSLFLLLENVGGALITLDPREVKEGMVVASQLRKNPNYFFNWIRDSALTIRSLIHTLSDSEELPAVPLKSIIELYIEANYHLQRTPNLSGDFKDKKRSALGEPKFMPNGLSFDEPWGRPQSDGPALRILTIAYYLRYLHDLGEIIENSFLGNTSNIYHNIIKPDLEYVIKNWKYELFDLWEEINSIHFFNALVQLRGIRDGMALSKIFEDSPAFFASLEEHFTELQSFILDNDTGFRVPSVPYIIETPSLVHLGRRSGLDAATLLGSIHAHSMDPGFDQDIPFDVDDSHILNTIMAMVTDMKFRYPVNHKYIGKSYLGAGLGRYPEDIYDGYSTTEGNPWFICTASVSEVLYKLVHKISSEKDDIMIHAETKEFYSLFIDGLIDEDGPTNEARRIEYGSNQYKQVLRNIFLYSDTFMNVIKEHIDSNGHMLEQFNKHTGYMQGAEDLTWSYSSFYNSASWRKKAQNNLHFLGVDLN